MFLKQGFSILELTLRVASSLEPGQGGAEWVGGCCPVHYTMLSSIPGLHWLHDSGTILQGLTTSNSSRHCQMSPCEAKYSPTLKNCYCIAALGSSSGPGPRHPYSSPASITCITSVNFRNSWTYLRLRDLIYNIFFLNDDHFTYFI